MIVRVLLLLALALVIESVSAVRRHGFLSKNKYVAGSSSARYADLCTQFSYFTQNIDHFNFNPSHKDTYEQRYIAYDKFWSHGGPIFFYTGNEGDIQWFCENTGFIWEIAPKFNALVVFAEHRYYGESLPFGNRSFETPYISYLTSEQALADFAYLIKHLKLNATSSPVIAFGGSYGGMLSAWIRMKYPNLVAGALAASAPVRQFVIECDSFAKVITNTFKRAQKTCPDVISSSWAIMDKYSETEQGLQVLSQVFHLCDPLTDVQQLKDWLSDLYGDAAMGDYPYEANFLSNLPPWPVKAMCKNITSSIETWSNRTYPIDILKAIYNGVNVYLNYTGQLKCVNIKDDIDSGTVNMVSWTYQTCTEFVFPMCSNGKTDMFEPKEWNLKDYTSSCIKQFSGTMPKSEWPVINYGVTVEDLKSYSNIIFSNGDLDPWSAGGFLDNVNDKIPALIIQDGAHHLDLRASNKDDPESVVIARLREIDIIQEWIHDYNQN